MWGQTPPKYFYNYPQNYTTIKNLIVVKGKFDYSQIGISVINSK